MSRKKIISISLISVILIFSCVMIFFIFRKNDNSQNQNSIYIVKKEVIENNIEISGNIDAAEIQTLQAQGDGTVKKVFFKEGDYVKKGQVILQLDSDEEDYNIEKHDYEYEQRKISGAKKELDMLKKQRDMLLKKLEKRQVIARIDGILVDLDAAEEDYFEAASTVGSLVDRSYLKADVEIVESDAPKLKVGQLVKMNFPAYSEELQGVVYSCPNVARITSRGASVVDAEIHVYNPPAEILPKYSFTGKIEITAPQDVLIVHRNAIAREKGSAFVQRLKEDGSIEKIVVNIVPYDIEYVKIISGLSEGDVLKSQMQDASGKNAKKNMGQMGLVGGKIPAVPGMPNGGMSGNKMPSGTRP